jgi:hypothetical protein
LPGVLAIVSHDDAGTIRREDDNFAVVGLFFESGEAEDALRKVERAVKADALNLCPRRVIGEGVFVIVT